MLEILNPKVYDLKESIVACRYAMMTELPEVNPDTYSEGLKRAKLLSEASARDPHVKCFDNFLTGIRVSFDLKYTQYITKQLQRYHWFDYVSSSSLMHRITKMDFTKCVNKYVTQTSIQQMKDLIDQYNAIVENHSESWTFEGRGTVQGYKNCEYEAFMMVISNCPMGTELFVRVSTDYKQLQTMYFQRENHRLKEDWGAFRSFVESLPLSDELITHKSHREDDKQ